MGKDLNSKICIIGGGPAGLSAAMFLEKKGYKNYTILEKSNEVGGKCHSPYYKGKRYDTGAVMGGESYFTIKEVQEFTGDTGKERMGPPLACDFRNKEGKKIGLFNPKNPANWPRLFKTLNAVKKFATLLETKYKGYDINGHRGVAEGRYDGYIPDGKFKWVSRENENLKDLALPFNEFCELNGISQYVKDVWVGPYTSFGYGYFDEIPAAYVLKYLDFQTIKAFITLNLWSWEGGTQSVWESLNDKLLHGARFDSIITKVERKKDKVFVTVNGVVEEYDYIIITSPLQFWPDYADATKDEKELFSKIDYERYDVLGVTVEPDTYPDTSYCLFDNMVPHRLGHMMLYFNRWKDDPNQIVTTYAIRNHRDIEEIPYEKCKKMVIDDLDKCGHKVTSIEFEKSWYYFPHVFSKDYANGWYDKVENLQGNKNTYYAGEIMSFGDMEEVAEYSKSLIERFF